MIHDAFCFSPSLTLINDTVFLYIACTDWSRDKSSETVLREYSLGGHREHPRSRAAQPGSQVSAARLSRRALLPRCSCIGAPGARGVEAAVQRLRIKLRSPLHSSEGLQGRELESKREREFVTESEREKERARESERMRETESERDRATSERARRRASSRMMFPAYFSIRRATGAGDTRETSCPRAYSST